MGETLVEARGFPSSTYRLQLRPGFTLVDAAEIVDYLAALGVGACYVSPILTARPGSLHGYDVTDHTCVNPELGGGEGVERLSERLRKHGMELVVDIVPNHMCIADASNWRWWDVLENGPGSTQARFFDIDWNPPRQDLVNKVLLPILGDQYGRVLENQEIRIDYQPGFFFARYYDLSLPLAPRSWPHILLLVVDGLRARLGDSDPQVLELESIITALRYLPPRSETSLERVNERQREKEVIKRRLAAVSSSSDVVAAEITTALSAINGITRDPASFDRLDQILADQAYRLAYWRVAADEINYRRFFDVNELAAIRVEDSEVFDATHRVIAQFIREGRIIGLRVDHPDGLFDPRQYFDSLQRIAGGDEPNWPELSEPEKRLFVIAEKIVIGDEELRQDWRIEGTTGYGFLNTLNGLFVYPANRRLFRSMYERLSGSSEPFGKLVYECKQLILRVAMSSELNVLARRLDRICQKDRHTRDFTLESLRFALREIIACFPVYRTYIRTDQVQPDEEDRRHILAAVNEAKRRNATTSESVFDAIGSILLLEGEDAITESQKAERRLFVMRFQQLTGPVMAKGVEDTAFYRYYPLASLNEVGGEPHRFGVSLQFFHHKNQVRLKGWRHAMLATSTHDTKRSEDVRARINVLSEIPVEWYRVVREWNTLNAPLKASVGGIDVPDINTEYLLYQTLVGVWPLSKPDTESRAAFVQRIQAYMEKATKEAKLYTSWINPNREYDRALRYFIAAILQDDSSEFARQVQEFVAPVAYAGLFNSLSQVLLKIASPGVPDLYQGCEVWNWSLVDPDNRRPVDFPCLQRMLEGLRVASEQNGRAALVDELMRTPADGRLKLFITSRALTYQRANRSLFETGKYIPVEASGRHRLHSVAFARRHKSQVTIAAAGRFFRKLKSDSAAPVGPGTWGDTALVVPKAAQRQAFRDIFTDRVVQGVSRDGFVVLPLGEVFSSMPVALLEGCD